MAGATISGNATDVFCDSTSVISGGSSIAGATKIQCGNLQLGQYETPLPQARPTRLVVGERASSVPARAGGTGARGCWLEGKYR